MGPLAEKGMMVEMVEMVEILEQMEATNMHDSLVQIERDKED